MAIRIHELNHVALHVSDLEASMHFYGEVIGLPQKARPAFDFPGAWYAFGDQELHLIADPNMTPRLVATTISPCWWTTPMPPKPNLTAKGITEFRGPAPRPDGAMQLFFNDPDGYVIELYTAVP